MNLKSTIFYLFFILIGGMVLTTYAGASGITVYQDGDKYVKLGGRIQLQYHKTEPDGADDTDNMFFRRLRPYIEGSLHKDWKGKFQWDMGKAVDDNEISIKDAYFQYKGIKDMTFIFGNANFPFSRELLTSSKKQQLVERTFVGDHNYGTPDRQLGAHWAGELMNKKITYGLSAASASIDPDANKIDFDTPVNDAADFNEGVIFGGRIDFHPLGLLKLSQGDFKKKTLATIGIAAFSWDNDDDNNTRTTAGIATDITKPDVDSITGLEISGAFRSMGFSIDMEYNLFNAETVDPSITSGMYRNGKTDLKNWAIEGGYMLIADRLEMVAGYESQDADNYAEEWTRKSVGLNYFIKKHDIKIQTTYRMGKNLKGVKDSDTDEFFAQMQYVF